MTELATDSVFLENSAAESISQNPETPNIPSELSAHDQKGKAFSSMV